MSKYIISIVLQTGSGLEPIQLFLAQKTAECTAQCAAYSFLKCWNINSKKIEKLLNKAKKNKFIIFNKSKIEFRIAYIN